MTSRRLLAFALAVFVAALALRVPLLGADLFHTDSVHQARAVESWVVDGEFAYMHRPGYPGQVLASAPLFWLHHALTGSTSAAFAVTLQSAIAGALAAGLMVLFARTFLETDEGAVAAGILAATLPTLLSTTTFAMSHGTQMALLLGAGIAAARQTGRAAIVAGALFGLAIATRTESVFLAPALLLIHWRGRSPVAFDSEKGVHLTVAPGQFVRELVGLTLPVVVIPAALYAKQFTESGLDAWREASGDTGWLGPVSLALPLGLDAAARTLTWGGAALAAVGTVVLARRDRSLAGIVLLWCLVPFVFLANTRIVVPRHLIPSLIVLVVSMAAVVEVVAARTRIAAAGIVLALAAWMVVPLAPTLTHRSTFCGPAMTSRAVGEAVPEGAVVMAMDLREHLAYFGGVRTIGHAALDGTAEDAGRIDEALASIRTALDAGTPVYLASDAFAYDVPHPDHGFAKAEIPGPDGVGREALGRLGIALVETFEIEHVLTSPYEDWHGASLGHRKGSSDEAHLYRVVR